MASLSSYQILKAEFDARKKKNKRYSIRAFAAILKVSGGRAHEILNGQHNLSLKMAQRFADRLSFDEAKKSFFLRLVESEIYLRKDGRRRVQSVSARLLSESEFALVSDWEYFALMALIESGSFRSEISWIAKKLVISERRVAEVLQSLQSQGLLKVNEAGQYRNTYSSMTTLIDIPSEIVRKANIDCILQGIEKMYSIDVMLRDVSSLTLPVDMQKMPEVKSLIREFKSKVMALMDKKQTTEIYNLNIQFVPVSELDV